MINPSERGSLVVARRASSLLLFWALILPCSLPAGEIEAQNALKAARDAVRETGRGADEGLRKELMAVVRALESARRALRSGKSAQALREIRTAQALFQHPAGMAKAEQRKAIDRALEALDSASGQLPGIEQPGYRSRLAKTPGLRTTTFDTPEGQISVYLPADARQGDTISGTVSAAPAGRTSEERTRNLQRLQSYVVAVDEQQTRPRDPRWTLIVPLASHGIDLFLISGKGDEAVAHEEVPLSTGPPLGRRERFDLPAVGQAGRPIVIRGPFDGRLETSRLKVGGAAASPLAESPREVVFRSPETVVGPVEIQIEEAGQTTTASFRNVSISLSAPRLDLRRGEQTTLAVQVSGLTRLERPLSFHLDNGSPGVVSISGGDAQTVTLQPEEVGAEGTYVWGRQLTGVQVGAFDIGATVLAESGGSDVTGPVLPGIFNGGAGYIPEHPCPLGCTTVVHRKGDIVRHCSWATAGPVGAPLVKGQILDSTACKVGGMALDVEPRHRLFVHGLHDNLNCWKDWYDYVKEHTDYTECPDCRTVRDNTGWSLSFGDGTTNLLSQVAELVVQINAGFAGVPDGQVDVYAHSLGALKIEALLQLGYEREAGHPWFQAARKIGRVYIFQGAHGGCFATAPIGDGPNHCPGACPIACPASRDIGAVNDANLYRNGDPKWGPRPGGVKTEAEFNPIPGSSSNWNMDRIVWGGQKKIYYVVADADGGDCDGGAMGVLCRSSERNDGVVYSWQMVPTWYAGFKYAKAAGHVKIESPDTESGREFCHMADDAHDRPMVSAPLMRAYIGLKNVRYFVAEWTETLIERDVTYCDEGCFCLEDRVGACLNKLDCTLYHGDNCKPPGGGGRGDPLDGDSYLPEGPDRGPLFTTPEVGDPAHPGGYDVQTTVLREIVGTMNDSGAPWTRCAAEGAVCAFSGTRQVRYGARGIYTTRTITDGTPCNNTVFGDPVPNVEKACDFQNETPK